MTEIFEWLGHACVHAEALLHPGALALVMAVGYLGYDRLEGIAGKKLIKTVFDQAEKKMKAGATAGMLAGLTNNNSEIFKVSDTCGPTKQAAVRFACAMTRTQHDLPKPTKVKVVALAPEIGNADVDRFWNNRHQKIVSHFAKLSGIKFVVVTLLILFSKVPNFLVLISISLDIVTAWVVVHYVRHFPTLEPACELLLNQFTEFMKDRFGQAQSAVNLSTIQASAVNQLTNHQSTMSVQQDPQS